MSTAKLQLLRLHHHTLKLTKHVHTTNVPNDNINSGLGIKYQETSLRLLIQLRLSNNSGWNISIQKYLKKGKINNSESTEIALIRAARCKRSRLNKKNANSMAIMNPINKASNIGRTSAKWLFSLSVQIVPNSP